ncbi:MAG: hypothetical protein FWC79_04145 [Oscillospiraceae bacterium]|nr:hypothetical protein [Oscillospiraceae bacterium]
MNTFHFIAIMIIAMCIGLIYLVDKKKKNKLELGMQRAAGIIAVVMLLTVNLPVLAGLYNEIVMGNDENNVAYYYDEEENEEELESNEEELYKYEEEAESNEYEEYEEYSDEEELEESEYIEIEAMGGYIPIMPLLSTIDFPTGRIHSCKWRHSRNSCRRSCNWRYHR